MKKKEIFKYAGFCFALLLFIVPEVSSQWEEMEVLNYYFSIDTGPRHQWYVKVAHNPINNEFMAVWRTSGKLRDDCDPGDEYECSHSFMSLDARRISPDGQLLADPIELIPPEVGEKLLPVIAHNVFANEYMVAFGMGPDYGTDATYILRTDDLGTVLYGPEQLLEPRDFAYHADIVFNSVREQYLVVYNDRGVFSEYLNLIGFILDENGTPIHGPFPVGNNQVGDLYAPRCAYNSTDDNYLCAWEDFRNVPDWLYPGDAYGALLDGNGDMIVEIPILDDYHMPGGDTYPGYESKQDQRVPTPCYNPDRNEFLVAWRDHRITSQDPDDAGIFARIIAGSDGSFKGSDFVMVDPPGMQTGPEMIYVKERKQYFVAFSDNRNDTEPPGTPLWFSDNVDIYATWLDESGMPIGGDHIPIAVEPGVQTHAKVAYNPVEKRFLIAWYEKGINVYDYDIIPGGVMLGAETPGDLRGTIYGVPQRKNPCLALKIYGEHSEEVEFLRQVRDNVLNKTAEGRELIKLYYEWSPAIVKAMEEDEEFKEGIKEMIDEVLRLAGGEID